MNRTQIETAIERNLPFVLTMADGKEYRVPHRDYISLHPRAAYVIVFDEKSEDDKFHVLPLLTMTGLRPAMAPKTCLRLIRRSALGVRRFPQAAPVRFNDVTFLPRRSLAKAGVTIQRQNSPPPRPAVASAKAGFYV